jgi:hypothetical protein
MAQFRIIQLATPNVDEYAKYSIASIRKYARMYGYEYFVQRSKTLQDLHINWTRLDVLSKKMKDFPTGEDCYLVMIDADTVIMNSEKPLTYFIKRYGQNDTTIFMARDTPFRIDFKKIPNAGFLIVKNNAAGQSIIKKWIHAAYHEGKQYRDTHPRTQLVYWNCVEPHIKEKQVVLPGHYFHKPIWWVPKPAGKKKFLYHITSTGDNQRRDMMRLYYEKTWNDHESLNEVESLLDSKRENLLMLN